MRCCNCAEKPVTRPRGLCWSCYYTPGVRELYAVVPTNGHARGARFRATPPAASSTAALPGTQAKVLVLRQRFKAREDLWHPLDAKLPAASGDAALPLG